MNCIVTAGPTYEPLDGVRRLTNLSTGRLGTELASYLVTKGHQVTFLRGYYAIHQAPSSLLESITFTTTSDLQERFQALAAPDIGAVFHAAAVSDFGFGRVFHRTEDDNLQEIKAGKFSTSTGKLLAELVPTPKLIERLRFWFPIARLVGWKYQVDGSQAESIRAGLEQLVRCRTDLCVVNGPAYGRGFGLVSVAGKCTHVPDLTALLAALGNYLES